MEETIAKRVAEIREQMIEAHVAAWIQKTCMVPRRRSLTTLDGEEHWIEPDGEGEWDSAIFGDRIEAQAAKFAGYTEWPADEVKLVRKNQGTKVSFRFIPLEGGND